MKKVSLLEITITIALIALLSIIVGILVNVVAAQGVNGNAWLLVGVFLVILTVLGTLFVIIQTVREKQQNQPDTSNVTSVSKDIAGRIIIREGPVTIEAPDAESAIKMLQVIFSGKSSLNVETGLTIEVKEPEERDAPETKRNEE